MGVGGVRRMVGRAMVLVGVLAGAVTVSTWSGTPASAALPSGVTLLGNLGIGDGSAAQQLGVLDGKVYFAANGDGHQGSLYVSDGEGNNSLVADINPSGDDGVANPTGLAGKVYFIGNDGTHGSEIWSTDGTAEGTTLLKDIQSGASSSNPYELFVLGSSLYFWAYPSGANGYQLWKSDGTTAGTTMVVETVLWDVTWVGNAGTNAYYIGGGGDPDSAYELWVTDGSAAGTKLVKDVFVSASSSPSNFKDFTPFGSSMSFATDNYPDSGLWITDGSLAGTVELYDAGAKGETMGGVAAVGGSLYATSYITGGSPSARGALVKSDGTLGGTSTPIAYSNSQTSEFGFKDVAVAGGALVLSHYSSTYGFELWTSDGTSAGTTLLMDVAPGEGYNSYLYNGDPRDFVSFGSSAAFRAGTGLGQLWVTDGTLAGTGMMMTFGYDALKRGNWAVDNDRLFFAADDFVYGRELWVSDGSFVGTELAYDVLQTGDSSAGVPIAFGGGVLYAGSSTGSGTELMFSDLTADSARVVKEIGVGTLDGSPSGFASLGATVVYRGFSSDGWRLYVTDATEAGTGLVKAGGGPSLNSGLNPVSIGTKALFSADVGSNDYELWVSDGTDVGTELVLDINPGPSGSGPFGLASMGGKGYFGADDGTNGAELWVSDGTAGGTSLVKDINPAGDGYPAGITAVGSTIFFIADDGTNGTELWKSDGTAGGTSLVKDINPAGSGLNSARTKLFAVGSTVYFAADDGTNGTELWKSDGTSVGTVMVKNIASGDASGLNKSTVSMGAIGSTLYFNANDGTNGEEFWKSDGTSVGTMMVKDITSGSNGSSLSSLVGDGSNLYFSACQGTAGCELWRSDGTSAGTSMAADLAPASNKSSNPQSITMIGSKVVFSAKSTEFGRELFTFDPKPMPIISFTPPAAFKTNTSYTLAPVSSNPATITVAASGECALDLIGRLRTKREGSCTITLSQEESVSWAAVTQSFDVAVDKARVSVTFNGFVFPSRLVTSGSPSGRIEIGEVSDQAAAQAITSPAQAGCEVTFTITPSGGGTVIGPFMAISGDDGLATTEAFTLPPGTYDVALELGGDCDGTTTPAAAVEFTGFALPPTGGSALQMALLALVLVLVGAGLQRVRRRPVH